MFFTWRGLLRLARSTVVGKFEDLVVWSERVRTPMPSLRGMFSYSGWTYIGASSALLRDAGGNILIN